MVLCEEKGRRRRGRRGKGVIQAIAAAHWPLTPPAGGSTSTTNPGELKILLTSDFTFRIEWIPLDENKLFVEMCLHWNSKLLWIFGGWLLCLCASLLINSVETAKTAADAFLSSSSRIQFEYCYMFKFWRVDRRSAKLNGSSSPPQICPAHQIWAIMSVIFEFLYSELLHGKELWEMVRVGGGEVKSKAKRKEEHDEAEQEQLGKLRLRDVQWRLKSNNSIDERQYQDWPDTMTPPSRTSPRRN